jgi:hypothetical protein
MTLGPFARKGNISQREADVLGQPFGKHLHFPGKFEDGLSTLSAV